MKKHTPLRMCVACRQMKPKDELIRFIKQDGKIVLDRENKVLSRGAYVCLSKECIEKTIKKHTVERHLKADASEVYEILNKISKEELL